MNLWFELSFKSDKIELMFQSYSHEMMISKLRSGEYQVILILIAKRNTSHNFSHCFDDPHFAWAEARWTTLFCCIQGALAEA